MKQLILFFSVLVLFTVTSYAQTAANYYLHLRVGNNLKFHTTNNSNWGARSTIYAIEGIDTISGIQYFRERGYEVMDQSGDTSVFRVVWLREDASHNIVLGAISPSGSPNVDSAIIMNFMWHPNEFLTPGYSRTYTFGDENDKDSVISNTETVVTPAGTFTNCIKIMVSHINNTGVTIFREYQYYAHNIGFVLNVRDIPIPDAHTNELIEANILMSAEEDVNLPDGFSLLQNYPNPFNPSTTISFSLLRGSFVKLKVYDIIGREVASLLSKEISAGDHSVEWNADNIPSGIYFYKLDAGSFSQTRKLVLLK